MTAPRWAVPEPGWPQVPADSVQEIRDGLATGSARGRLDGAVGPVTHWHRGAVYRSDRTLVRESQRVGGLHGDVWVAADSQVLTPEIAVEQTVGGHWYYGGHWLPHFGHFLLETLPNLWAHGSQHQGIVFHPWGGFFKEPVKLDLLRLAGVTSEPQIVTAVTRFEHLTVPTRPSVLNGWATGMAGAAWQRIASAVCAGRHDRRIWLSRARFESENQAEQGKARRVGGAELDEVFRSLGFEIVFPEEYSIEEQIKIARESEVLAGVEGSALHLSAFAHPGCRVVVVGTRDRPRGNRAQVAIDSAVGNPQALIPYVQDGSGYDTSRVADSLEVLLAELA